MSIKLKAGILGATGAVGQKFVEILAGHPWFEITALAASERSAGKPYREAANWIGAKPIPEDIADRIVVAAEPGIDCDFVFSGLDSSVAGDLERSFAEAGYPVISNARNYRMHDDVPLLIPEVNPDHTRLIERQSWQEWRFYRNQPKLFYGRAGECIAAALRCIWARCGSGDNDAGIVGGRLSRCFIARCLG